MGQTGWAGRRLGKLRIDIGTLIVVMSLFAMIQAAVLLYQYKLNKAYPGIGWWAAGSLSGAAGFALNVLREMEPFRIWSLIAGNGLLVVNSGAYAPALSNPH